jgi:hypothetical protein
MNYIITLRDIMYNVSEGVCRVAVQLCTESRILNYKVNNTKERKKELR